MSVELFLPETGGEWVFFIAFILGGWGLLSGIIWFVWELLSAPDEPGQGGKR